MRIKTGSLGKIDIEWKNLTSKLNKLTKENNIVN